MYTRSFLGNEEKLTVPENYDGNAFFDTAPQQSSQSIPPVISTETKISPGDTIPKVTEYGDEEYEECGGVVQMERSSPLKFLPSSLGNLFKLDSFKLGSEEILIIAVAAFLFFSKGGDKECALFLLLLLFVG